jgi:Tfp pilus assembly protein FimT
MPGVKLRNNTGTLAREISLARIRAIAKSVRFRIDFSPTAESYTLSRESGGSWVTLATSKLSGTDLEAVANFRDTNAVIADWNGAMSVGFGQQGTITLSTPDGTKKKRVVVEPTGRVFTEHSENGGSTWAAE